MQYRRLGTTDLNVSLICLGTMTWGEQNSEAEAHAQLDRALEYGINFIDAAEMYPVPPRAETFGRTEDHIGTWLKRRPGARSKVILATKVTGANNAMPHVRDGRGRLDRKNIEAALDGSLQRLQTDYIDLYQTHSPDRKVNAFGRLGYSHEPASDGAALEETLDVLGDFVKAGKVRHVGVSNETAWGAMQHLTLAASGRGPRIESIQNPYNLLNRTFEVGLAEVACRANCGLLAYSPLAMGVLAGKYLDGARPPGCRLTLFERFKRYSTPRAEPAAASYVKLARDHGLDPAKMALAFVNTRPFLTSTIIGCTSLAQLDQNVASLEIKLSADVLAAIEAIHAANPNPCP
ncbi:MAG TPA: NADP(H)-dependent aldo-keto reductase [Alphaproteobacteria bacterium]|nr:NADP(H)-dependent aldo-keto reductase [Alphaproteobacteria bacterium]